MTEKCPHCQRTDYFGIMTDSRRICKCGTEWPAPSVTDAEIMRQAALILRLKSEVETLRTELDILKTTGL